MSRSDPGRTGEVAVRLTAAELGALSRYAEEKLRMCRLTDERDRARGRPVPEGVREGLDLFAGLVATLRAAEGRQRRVAERNRVGNQ